jgi:elongation factor P
MLSFSEIKLGSVINYNNQPYVVTKCDFLKMQMAKPTKKCKLKNIVNGTNIEYTFKSGENIEEADLRKEKATFMYSSGEEYSFMTVETYETVEINRDMLGGKEGYIKDGLEVVLVYFNDAVVSVELPIKISYKVIHTTEANKGNTVSDVMKDAQIETGINIKVPGFIKIGENILVNTVEDEYAGRDTESNK